MNETFTINERMAALETQVANIDKKLDEMCAKLDALSNLQQRWDGVSWAIARVCAVVVGSFAILSSLAALFAWLVDHHITLH